MNLNNISQKWKDVASKLAANGLPVLMLRDPLTKKASLPFTMVTLSIVLVVVGIVGKLSMLVGGIDKGLALQFLTTSAALYFGHSWVSQTTIEPDGQTKKTDLKTGDSDAGQ
jgi:hypothetical protein